MFSGVKMNREALFRKMWQQSKIKKGLQLRGQGSAN